MSVDAVPTALAHVAFEAAAAVAPYLRAATRSGTGFTNKADHHDPVTVHDKATEAALQAILARAIPGSRILGEENGEETLFADHCPIRRDVADVPVTARWREALPVVAEVGSRVRWIVDPIDGTANFAAGLPWWCTSIGVELDGQVEAGAIVAPLIGEAWVADDSTLWHVVGEVWTSVDAPRRVNERDAVFISYYPGPSSIRRDALVAMDRERRMFEAHQTIRRTGASALDMAHIASGWCAGMMGMSFGPWDMAAGAHMVRVSGGTIVNPECGSNLPYGLRPHCLAIAAGAELPTARAVFEEIIADRVGK